jgi:hypothetical protein
MFPTDARLLNRAREIPGAACQGRGHRASYARVRLLLRQILASLFARPLINLAGNQRLVTDD